MFRSLLHHLARSGSALAAIGVVAVSAQISLAPTSANPEPILLAQSESLTPVKFTLSWLLQGVDAHLALAMEKGYFQEEGLDVTFERGFGSADSIGKIAAGQYDIGFGDIYSMIEFNQKNPDQQLIAIAVPYNKSPFVIITLKESGIDTPEALGGRKLGAPAGDAPRRLWPVFAKQVGVEPGSAEWTSMEPKLRQTFLLTKQVEAISGFSYSALPELVNGGKGLDDLNLFYYNDNGLDFYGNAVITRVDYAEENPEVLQGFLKAYIRGFQDMVRDPDAGLQAVLDADEGGLLKDADERLRLRIALEDLIITEEVEENGIGSVDPERLESTIAQVVEGFELSETPTVDQVFDDSFLPPAEERELPPVEERGALSE